MTQDRAEGSGAGDAVERADGGDAPPPLVGRGTPDEQARAIVAQIILETPGGGTHSGQTPALPSQQAQYQEARGQGRRGRRSGDRPRERQRRGGTQNPTDTPRRPPEQRAPPAPGMQRQGGEGGAGPQPDGEGGAPPKQACMPFLRGLIQEMGGNPQTCEAPPPNARRSKGEGVGEEGQGETGVRGAHLPH